MRSLALVGLICLVGCYDTPKPKCAFLCGPASDCPADYMCGSDGRCHLLENGSPATCEDTLPVDAAVSDAPFDAPPPADAGPDAAFADAGPPDATPPIDAMSADAAANDPPVLTLTPSGTTHTIVAGETLTITASATDPDVGDTLTFSAPYAGTNQDPYTINVPTFGSEPAGGTFVAGTHVFTFTTGILGDFDVRFTVSDGVNAPVTQTVTITVTASPVMLNEVEVGTGADQAIELINTSGAPVDIGNWQICVPFQYYTIPAGTMIPAGAFITIHWHQAGGDTATDLFTGPGGGFNNVLNTVQQVVLFFDGSGLHQSRDMIDFVRWGAGSAVRAQQAAAANQWPDAAVVVAAGGIADATSVARTPGANTEAPADWYTEGTPSIGAANDGTP